MALFTQRHGLSVGRSRSGRVQRMMLVLVGALLVGLLPASSVFARPRSTPKPKPRTAKALPGAFTPGACPIAPIEGLRTDCGMLTVPESHTAFTGKTLQLAVAILRSPNARKAADPVVFLSGGPGQGALALAPFIAQGYAPLLAQRDIILIDQRGTGFSQPALNCPTNFRLVRGQVALGLSAANDRPEVLQQQVDFLRACGAALRQAGHDLRAYNSIENAADLEDLRRALGYGPWNLVGGSYGTRLALTSMQYRPETIRSVVLDSVYPLQANFHTGVFGSFNRSLDLLFADCAADAACNAAYPELGQAYDKLIAQLNAQPTQIPILDPETGKLITYLPLTGVDTASILFSLFYVTPIIPLLPLMISEASQGNYEILGEIASLLLFSDAGTSLGMQVAVQCNEDATFATPRDFVAARDTYRRASPLAHSALFNEAVLEICADWGLAPSSPALNQAVISDRPALIIGGEYDPITPLENAAAVAADLPNSSVVTYPNGGHTPSLTSPCLANVVAAFIATPGTRPDAGCVAQEAETRFVVR